MGTSFGYKSTPTAGSKPIRRLLNGSTNKWGQLVGGVSDPILRGQPASSPTGLIVGDDLIIVLKSTTGYTSPDGATWTQRVLPAGQYVHSAMSYLGSAYANGVYLYVSSTTEYYTSTNGIDWTLRTLPSTIDSIFYWRMYGYNGIFFFHNGRNPTSTYYTSTDGINWTARTAPASNSGMSMTAVNDKFFWSGGGNFWSSDGINWNASTIGVPSSMAYANNMYIAFGSGVYTSPDLTTWTLIKNYADLSFFGGFALSNGAMLVLGSERNYYWNGSLQTDYICTLYKTDPQSGLFPIKRGTYTANSGIGLYAANTKVFPFKNTKYVLYNFDTTNYLNIAIVDTTDVYEIVTEL